MISSVPLRCLHRASSQQFQRSSVVLPVVVAASRTSKDDSASRRAVAGAAVLGFAGVVCWAKPSAHCQEWCIGNGTYHPPAKLGKSFKAVSNSMPSQEPLQLAWAVKNLNVNKVKSILEGSPHQATLIDDEGNTLFHLLAEETSRCSAQPQAAKQVMQELLKHGWDTVDHKNDAGLRAEIVAQRSDPKGVPAQLLRGRSHDYQEPFRFEKPVKLVGEMSPVPEKWEYVVNDDQRRCYAGYIKGGIPAEKAKEWLETTINEGAWIKSSDAMSARMVAWYVSEDFADVDYKYSGNSYPATVFPPFMHEIREEVCRICGLTGDDMPNSCNVNCYTDQSQEVGWHSDDEVMFQSLGSDTRIISVSLGVDREFCYRLQGTSTTLGSMSLGNGDIMTMEGMFQKHYKHSVPPSNQPCSARINFTFRTIRVKAHAADAEVVASYNTNVVR